MQTTFIKNVLPKDLHLSLVGTMKPLAKTFEYHIEMGRWRTRSGPNGILDQYAEYLLPLAKRTFNSKTLLPSYSAFAHYEGVGAKLIPHKDDNACTYTIDMCLYQTEPWDLIIEGTPYTLQENEAVAFYGNEQKHWRNSFPNPEHQKVGMAFFHYVEPTHWSIKNGVDYIRVLRGEITENEYFNQ